METDTSVSCVARTISIRFQNRLTFASEISAELAINEKTNKLRDACLCFKGSKTHAIMTKLILLFTLNKDRSIAKANVAINVEATAKFRTMRSNKVGYIHTSCKVQIESITVKTSALHTIATQTAFNTPNVIEIVNEIKTSIPRHTIGTSKFRIVRSTAEIVKTTLYCELPLGEVVTLFRIVCIGLLVEVPIAASCNSIVISSSGLLNRCFILGDDDYSVVTLSENSRYSAQAKR